MPKDEEDGVVLKISLKRERKKVEIEEEDGTVRVYELVAMMSPERDGYLNFTSNRVKLNKDGTPVGYKDFDGFQANLISRCLYDPDGNRVPESVVKKKFPGPVQQELFDLCQSLNRLTEESREAAKKA